MPPPRGHDGAAGAPAPVAADADEILKGFVDLLRRKWMRHTDLFKSIDASGDGIVTSDELRTALTNLGFQISEQDFQALLSRFDASSTGEVSFHNFDRCMKQAEKTPLKRVSTHKKRGLSSEELEEFRQIFCLFKQLCRARCGDDISPELVQWDDTGSISVGDLEGLLDTVGLHLEPAEMETMIREMDIDGNGSIDFAEFCEAMARKAQVDYPPEEIAQCFKTFAKNAPDGMIRVCDLRHALQTYMHRDIGDADVEELLAHYRDCFVRLPGNEHEFFNYQEYIELMTPLGSHTLGGE